MISPGDESGHSMTQSFASYLRARLQLLGIESQEAFVFFKGKLLPAVIVACCGLVAYLFVLAAVVSLLGKGLAALGKSDFLGWEIPALLVATLHVAVLLRFRRKLLEKPADELFEYTRAEIENDRQWLHENTSARKP